METRLEHNLSVPNGFYKFLVKARNPKTNEVKMVDWFEGKVTIEIETRGYWHYISTYSDDIMKFWLGKFGKDLFVFRPEDDYQFHKVLKETAKFVDAPYIEGCALTKEWIRYEMINPGEK